MKNIFLILLILCSGLINAQETAFSKEALNEVLLTENNEEITFSRVLEKYKGKKVLIDFWANWCRDCIEGMPALKQLQKEKQEVVFLFLSLDRSPESWKYGLEKYGLEGEHYFISSGWKGSALCTSVNLDWIPRYMVVDEEGKIVFFKAITTQDEELLKHL